MGIHACKRTTLSDEIVFLLSTISFILFILTYCTCFSGRRTQRKSCCEVRVLTTHSNAIYLPLNTNRAMHYSNKTVIFFLWKMVEILSHFTWEPSSAEMNNSWFLPHQPKWKWLNAVSTSQTIHEQNKFTCNTYWGEQNATQWINLVFEWWKLILQNTVLFVYR